MHAQRSPVDRTAGILLLAVVASISLALSALPGFARTRTVPAFTAHPASSSFDPVAVAWATPAFRSRAFVPACPRTRTTVLPTSATSQLKGRIFAEDTRSSSSDVLKAARLECVMESRTTPYPVSPALQNNSASVSNRQRAP